MEKALVVFELHYNGATIKVQEHTFAERPVYRIVFPDKRPPLIITIASNIYGSRFWTSVPEGRQQEAEAIGTLISEHLNIQL